MLKKCFLTDRKPGKLLRKYGSQEGGTRSFALESVIEFLSLMDPNSNEYLSNPANIYVRNSKPPKITILIDLKNKQKTTCSNTSLVQKT